jgi:hypothetical protein
MTYDTIAPRPNGRIMPAAAIHAAITPDLPREFPGQLVFSLDQSNYCHIIFSRNLASNSSFNYAGRPILYSIQNSEHGIQKLGLDENGGFQYLRIFLMSNSNPTRKRKKMSPTSAIVSRTVKELSGKMFLVKPGMLPKAVGPNNMPPIISAQVMQIAHDETLQRQSRRICGTLSHFHLSYGSGLALQAFYNEKRKKLTQPRYQIFVFLVHHWNEVTARAYQRQRVVA